VATTAGAAEDPAARPPTAAEGAAPARAVGPVPEELQKALELSPFYRKHVSAGGLPVLSSEKVSDFALLEAPYLIDRMFEHRPDVRQAMIERKARVGILAVTEFTTDIPEHSHMKPKEYADKRARGMGGPRCVSAGEENLLGYPGDPYAAENILIHEFAHGIHEMGLRAADPTFQERLRDAYRRAMDGGLWKGAYAATNPGEYWAEGVQSWFDTNRENDAAHNHVDTREELKEYDPRLAGLVAEVFGDRPWRYRKPAEREDPGHLRGFDRAAAPRFAWPEHLLEWNRKHAAEVERGRRRREELTLAPPGAGEPPASQPSDKETSIIFINRTPAAVSLYWIDLDGKKRPYGEVAAGERVEQATFAGHVWLLAGGDGKPLATVVATPNPGRAVLSADRGPPGGSGGF
jgi:hypothetical protein